MYIAQVKLTIMHTIARGQRWCSTVLFVGLVCSLHEEVVENSRWPKELSERGLNSKQARVRDTPSMLGHT